MRINGITLLWLVEICNTINFLIFYSIYVLIYIQERPNSWVLVDNTLRSFLEIILWFLGPPVIDVSIFIISPSQFYRNPNKGKKVDVKWPLYDLNSKQHLKVQMEMAVDDHLIEERCKLWQKTILGLWDLCICYCID